MEHKVPFFKRKKKLIGQKWYKNIPYFDEGRVISL